MSDPLAPDAVRRVIGVIDLLEGRAVHAVAGHRESYAPVARCGGDPVALIDHYARLGVQSFYVADLDSIGGGTANIDVIDAICESASRDKQGEVLIDIGWTGADPPQRRSAVKQLSASHGAVRWIAATESCSDPTALFRLADDVAPRRVLLGLDYRDGRLITSGTACGEESRWIDRAAEIGCVGTVILDLAGVGTAAGPATVGICQRVKRHAPDWVIYSGGGIRSGDDIQRLVEAGADFCLMATALHRMTGCAGEVS